MKVKRFKAGLKSGFKPLSLVGSTALGAAVGGFIGDRINKGPGNRASNIGCAIGAGVGALGAIGLGYRRGVKDWDYNNDPEILKKRKESERENLNQELDEKISEYSGYNPNLEFESDRKELKSYEKKYGVTLRKDLYSFIKFTAQFYKKNLIPWYNCMKDCNNPAFLSFAPKFDELFAYIYVENETYWDEDVLAFGAYGENAGDGLEYWSKKDVYSFFGGETFKNFSELADRIKIYFKTCSEPYKDDPEVLHVHQRIVDEYCRGLKQIH